MDDVVTQVGAFAPLIMNAVKALVVLILGWIVAGAIGGMVRRRINATPHIDQTLGNFVASLVKWVILAMVLVAVSGHLWHSGDKYRSHFGCGVSGHRSGSAGYAE